MQRKLKLRKLVTIRQIGKILPIPNADAIEEVQVDGWSVVSQKGIHSVGDLVLYFEIDSFLPESDPRFASFMKFGTQTFEGVVGHRLKTKRLRGVYSQGIIIPLNEFPEVVKPLMVLLAGSTDTFYDKEIDNFNADKDIAELIGVVKYEKPEPANGYQGDAKGTFPSFLRKSDQERIQNLYHKVQGSDEVFAPTLKMDGSSVTVFYVDVKYVNGMDDIVGYCSRNQLLKIPDSQVTLENTGNFYQGVFNSRLFAKAAAIKDIYGFSCAIQGELVGPGIQGNFEKFDTYQVFAYRIFNVDTGQYLDYADFVSICEALDIQRVPLADGSHVQAILQKPLSEILAISEGKSINNKMREGIVWQSLTSPFTFKAISNKYLEKNE